MSVERSAPKGAVFLSYASQDAEAARRMAGALRAAGVEVWFDQNELVGGDAWDQKIRKQIKECALLIPIISANTQSRTEGYFRLEWRLADQRTHLMAKGRPFLLPVVIDDTRDAEAQVPDSFTEVQWTRLPGGAGGGKFAARVKTLLSGGGTSSRESGSHTPIPASQELSPPRKTGKRWLIPAILGVVAITAIAFWFVRKPAANVGHETPAPRTQTQNHPPAVPLSDVRQLVERARGLMDKLNVLPGDLNTAAGLLEQAAKLAPNDALVWSTWALLDLRYVSLDYDNSPSRHNAARTHAAQANALDPASRETRYTQAEVMRSLSYDRAAAAAAEQILRPMLTEAPEDGRVLIQLGWAAGSQGRRDEAIALFDRAALLPASTAAAMDSKALALVLSNQFEAGDHAYDQLLALQPTRALALCNKAWLSVAWHADLDAARDFITRIPPQMRVEDMPAYFAYGVYMFRREYDQAVQTIRAVPRDYLSAQPGPGPSGFYIGDALAAAGKSAAAEIEWRSALATVERRLAEAPSDETLMKFKALLLARLGDRVAGERVWQTVIELHGDKAWGGLAPALHVEFLPPDEAIAWLNGRLTDPQYWFTAAALRISPVYDPLRTNPKFTALVEKMEADPRFSPKAKLATSQKPEVRDQKSANSLNPSSLSPSPSDQPKVDQKSVAVLAFANLSDDKANEYFSDGISEELLNVLAKIPGLKVAARTSAFYFKGKEVPVPEIARQLGVAYVVEGSVRKQGDKVRITAQLIKAADGFHVWSDTFTRDLKDIFAVQDEIAGLIAKTLELKMGMGEVSARQAVSPEAYQEYLIGRAAAARAGAADMREAVTHFDRAVALEPKYTAAWVQLASAHTRLGRWGGAPTRQAWLAARVAIDRARALEPDSPEVLLALGWILRTGEWNWREAERAFRRALALQPNQPEIMAGAAVLLFNIGQTDEAFRLARQAIQLDPLNAGTQIDLSIMFHLNKNWAEAERSARRALQLAPGGTSYHCLLSWGLIVQQRYAEAEAEIGLDNSEDGVDRALSLGLLALARGQEKVARDWLARLEEIARTNGDLADLQQNIAWLNTSLGEKDRAFAALEKAFISRDPSMSWLLNSWWLDPLHSDSRWPALVRKVGLADDQLK